MSALSGKHAFVTGGGTGVGAAIALALAEAGARVTISGRNQETLKEIADKTALISTVVCDVTDPASVDAAFAEIRVHNGPADIVVANAGINGVWAPVEEITPAEWDETMAINLRGTFLTVRATVPLLKKQGGAIVLGSSIQGNRTFHISGASAYAASKAAQVGFGRMIAVELGAFGIRVNTICPGAIHTDIRQHWVRRNLDQVRVKRTASNGGIPLTQGKGGEPAQVADSVLFLASDAASHITGTEVYIDGGQSLQ